MKSRFGALYEGAEQLPAYQLAQLRWTVGHAHAGSPFYRQRLDAAGVGPGDIRSLDDLRRLPFTTADDLRQGYPLPLLSVPPEQLVRIHSSSGTTGKRKILGYTARDVADWTRFFARCYEMAGVGPGDRVQIAVGYGLWTAGVSFQAGCEAAGAMAVPVGPGNMELQLAFLEDLQSNVMCCTSSMGLLLAEEIHRRGLAERIGIRTVIQGSERCSDAMRSRIQDLLGAEHVYDISGLTELYGPGAGIDCAHHQGIHYWADYYLLEFLDPESLQPVAEGEIGEMVVTTLRKEAAPLIRYRTRDLCRALPGRCACGSVFPRHDRILGRSDDMIIYRAVNIYPGQIDEMLGQTPGVASEYRVVLERRDGLDQMTVEVERAPDGDPAADPGIQQQFEQRFKREVMVSARLKVVDYNQLPRTERKSQRIYDNR
jgi:phenylacetate-CoA ligase